MNMLDKIKKLSEHEEYAVKIENKIIHDIRLEKSLNVFPLEGEDEYFYYLTKKFEDFYDEPNRYYFEYYNGDRHSIKDLSTIDKIYIKELREI